MNLSIIIVNYNVKHFLNQCLKSIKKAKQKLSIEIFVVDNNSVDRSIEMIKEEFPEVILIANKKNIGFAKANNQAIKQAIGEYILLLNPDTIIQENTLIDTINFFNNNNSAGGLGVKMIDGRGFFLPESKRSFPSPSIAFYKIFGLSKLFPKSKRFGRYHLNYLDENKITEIDVISGAFLMTRKKIINKIGMLDETFFMYGEDIDFSYRIQKAGYKNFYFPKTSIIHYKGESTKKSSINYIYTFYKAMAIFTKKHYSKKNANLLILIINIAILIRASISIIKRLFVNFTHPLIDAIMIVIGTYILKNIWGKLYFLDNNYYGKEFIIYVTPLYVLFWIIGIYMQGGYNTPIKIKSIIKGILYGTIAILITYALLPDTLRFSRALIILVSAWTILTTTITRYLFSITQWKTFKLHSKNEKRIGIVSGEKEFTRIEKIINTNNSTIQFIGRISNITNDIKCLGTMPQLGEILKIHHLNEIIFSAKDVKSNEIISYMAKIPKSLEIKIAPSKSTFIIGSNSIHSQGELYILNKKNKKKNTIKVIFEKISDFF